MQERHSILKMTIGYLDEEQEALDRGYRLMVGSFLCILVGSLLEFYFLHLYNGSCHPFSNILKDPEPSKVNYYAKKLKLAFDLKNVQ